MILPPLPTAELLVLMRKEALAGQLYNYNPIIETVEMLYIWNVTAQFRAKVRYYFDKLQLGGQIEDALTLWKKVIPLF